MADNNANDPKQASTNPLMPPSGSSPAGSTPPPTSSTQPPKPPSIDPPSNLPSPPASDAGPSLSERSSIRTMKDDLAGTAPKTVAPPKPPAPKTPPPPIKPLAPAVPKPPAPAPANPMPPKPASTPPKPTPDPASAPPSKLPPLFNKPGGTAPKPPEPLGKPRQPAITGSTLPPASLGTSAPPPMAPKPPMGGSAKPPLMVPPPAGTKRGPSLDVPDDSHSSKKAIVITAIILLALILALVWFFAIRDGDSDPTPTPATPTPNIATPTPRLDPIEGAFAPIQTVRLDTAASDAYIALDEAIATKNVLPGDPIVYHVIDGADPSATPYTYNTFNGQFSLNTPADVLASIDANEFYFTLFKDARGNTVRGYIVRVTNPGGADIGMRQWESTISNDLANLFKLDTSRAASDGFLETTYQTQSVRYRNFNDPFSTVDHAVMTTATGETYLLVTNTRDHIFALIDALRGSNSSLGK